MNIGICNLSAVPLRAEASHRSEMVSQVLFAEQFEILKEEKDWLQIRLLDADYIGWLQGGQFLPLSERQRAEFAKHETLLVDLAGGTAFGAHGKVDLFPGTWIPGCLLQDESADFPFQVSGSFREPKLTDFDIELAKLIPYYNNSPYLWGGRTRTGIDCSGLTQALYHHFGLRLPRDAYQQAEAGTAVSSVAEIKPGDLAFFENENGRIVHVGMMLSTNTIFHASAYVRTDRLDSAGIFNLDQKCYTHKLRIVKRYW